MSLGRQNGHGASNVIASAVSGCTTCSQSACSMSRSAAALASGFLWQISPATNLLTAAACGLAGTLLFAWQGRDLH